MRERGLKLTTFVLCRVGCYVAPHAGAWIETLHSVTAQEIICVAPHPGAWIETLGSWLIRALTSVAPHAGAWIET